LVLKIAPELDEDVVRDLAEAVRATDVDGVISEAGFEHKRRRAPSIEE
jgi:dihydroorotate dehydrogenase